MSNLDTSATHPTLGHASNHERAIYQRFLWGESIEGTKAQIQEYGIGVGLPFPGEPGGKVRDVVCEDPRSFKCLIWRRDEENLFHVTIWYPGRSDPSLGSYPVKEFAPGVTCQEFPTHDHYSGSMAGLIDAGLVKAGHFPGQPGRGKTTVWLVNGEVVDPKLCDQSLRGRLIKTGKDRYEYSFRDVSVDEYNRRDAERERQHRDWVDRMSQMPYIPALVPQRSNEAALARRASFALVK